MGELPGHILAYKICQRLLGLPALQSQSNNLKMVDGSIAYLQLWSFGLEIDAVSSGDAGDWGSESIGGSL